MNCTLLFFLQDRAVVLATELWVWSHWSAKMTWRDMSPLIVSWALEVTA